MTLSIAEALHQAQEAIDGGDYQSAALTCGQLVGQFPAFGAAWRTLGEAEREQGNTAEAQRAYVAALQRNYRNPAVYLGLGLLAEDQGVSENALAFCQVAWELAPQHGHLREPLTRAALRRFGSDGELQYSRAALAQLHVNGHRLRRAVEEYRRALAALPGRVDISLGLAECLWRMGQDAEAASLCRTVLEAHPEAGQALVMLAEIERRTGNARKGDELLKRLRAVDPDGALARDMTEHHPRADAAWLVVPPQAIPFLSEFLPAAPVERPRIAPAPDFEYQPSRPEIPTPAMEDLAPISLAEFGGQPGEDFALPSAPASSAFPAFPDMMDLDDLGITEEPFSLGELGELASLGEPGLPEDALGFNVPPATGVPFEPALSQTPSVSIAAEPDLFAEFSFDLPTDSIMSGDPFEDMQIGEAVAAVAPVERPRAPEIDPATVNVTDLDLPAGVPPTGELTPSEATGLGFEDFSGTVDATVTSATDGAMLVAGDDSPTETTFDQPFVPFDRAPTPTPASSLADTFLPAMPALDADAARYFDDTFDLSGFADSQQDVASSSQPDFPTMPLESRMPADDLRALSDLASVFDTPVGADAPMSADMRATHVLETPPAAPTFPGFDAFDGEVSDLSSLAASLEEDIAGALARAGEPIVNVQEPIPGTGFTTMLASIGAEGLAPFDPRGQEQGGFDMSSELGMDDNDALAGDDVLDHQMSAPATTDYPPATMDIAQITQNWDSIDDEILRAMPDGAPHGYTAELRSLDDFGLEPFEIKDEDIDGLAGMLPFDPYQLDAQAAIPIHPILPEEPLSVPPASAPHTLNGIAPAHDAHIEPATSTLNELGPIGEDDLLGGLQPFSFEEFDGSSGPVSGAKSGLGSLLPASWEARSGASAMPSDADLAALLSLGDDMDLEMGLGVDEMLSAADPGDQALNSFARSAAPETSQAFDFSIDLSNLAGEPSTASIAHESNDLSPDPRALTNADLDPFLDATMVLNRQVGAQDTESAEPLGRSDEPSPPPASAASSVFDDMPQRLTPDTELFTRTRLVKQEMMSEGVISGTRELEGMAGVEAETHARAERDDAEDAIDTRQLPDSDSHYDAAFALHPDTDFSDPDDDAYDDVISSTGATRDTTTLRAALEVTPNDEELRWWLAEALRERGDMDAAYTEYRWLIRHASERHEAILHALQVCVERDQSPEMAHRLIGDIYRRRGDLARSSNHATLALQVRRRTAVRVH